MGDTLIVDREKRDRLATVLRSYVNQQITDIDLDEEIHLVLKNTKDRTAIEIALDLHDFTAPYTDTKAKLPKETWDYLQRVILLLASDAHMIIHKHRIWHVRQIIAVTCLILIGYLLSKLQAGQYFNHIAIPFGFISFILAIWKCKPWHGKTSDAKLLAPFTTHDELVQVRKQTNHFKKQPWIRPIPEKSFDIPGEMTIVMWLSTLFISVTFTPIMLLILAFPERRKKICIRY